jgi:hypothetical protein|tara:strand:- start:498 stop:686 length:189 start_codon:yes stop_codon:yes gene_type:complete
MAEDSYTVEFRAPALPYAPKEYEEVHFNQLNNVLRLYFNQLDNVVRDTSPQQKSDAFGWFMG